MKRQRGRGRKSGNPGNRSLESNGPEVKIRGTAAQIYDKYMQYARDAQTSGDRVKAENFLQHAEHYYRLMAQHAPAKPRHEREEETDAEAAGSTETEAPETSQDPLKVMDEGEAGHIDASETEDGEPGSGDDAPKPRRRRTRRKPPAEDGQVAASEDKEAGSALDALAQEQAAIASN